MSEQERVVLHREFAVDLQEGDGRTVDLRVVPYNQVARVADPPDYKPYDEMWIPGAFERQLAAANRVPVFLSFEHEKGLRGIIGHGTDLREEPDGLQGTFRMHENADGDKALGMLREQLLGGVSLEAVALRSQKRNGIVERVRGHLDKVTLCRPGLEAYKGAQVLAVRTEPPPAPEPMADELLERLAHVGYEPLLLRAVVRKPWDGSAARYTDEQYQAACLIDRGGDQPPKERCSLPVLEPNGDLNANALPAAAAALSGGRTPLQGVTAAMKAAAARKLIRYYRQAQMPPPPALQALAARG